MLGVGGLVVLGPWVVRFMANPAFVPIACAVLPWYASAMIPLTLANVLINNLLAKSDFKLVPSLCVLAVVYGVVLNQVLLAPARW